MLTLLISLWALYWSFRDGHPTLPEWLPEWPFLRHGFDTLMWVVLIGADADTYGASGFVYFLLFYCLFFFFFFVYFFLIFNFVFYL